MAAEVVARWEAEAARYDAIYDAPRGRGWVARARLSAALELLGEGPGRVLDVGMGGGRLCAELERRGWKAYGVDPAEAMVAHARRRLPRAAERLSVGRAEELRFEDESFDAVCALGSLEYTDDIGVAARELARVLRDRGVAVVSWPNYRGLYPRWRRLVLYPAVRAAKVVVPARRPTPPPARNPLDRASFMVVLGSVGFLPEQIVQLGPRGGRLGSRLGPVLAAQLVVSARKEGRAP
jgi:ubiquinone/menaquinone biosynthesis C-methylase UbiE